MIRPLVVRHLVEAPDALPILSRWFVEAWEPYYGPEGPGDAEADLRAANARDRLPLCLVALDAHAAPVGTVALKAESLASHRHLSPWVAAFLVPAHCRGQGIGTALLHAIQGEARRLGHRRLYAGTETADRLLERLGWKLFDAAPTLTSPVRVYSLDLD